MKKVNQKNSKNTVKTANKTALIQGKQTQKSLNEIVLAGVLNVMSKYDSWDGTMTELSESMAKSLKKEAAMLPKAPSFLRVVLNRIQRKLRANNVKMTFQRSTDHNRTRIVSITQK